MNPRDVDGISATIDYKALIRVWHEGGVIPCFSYMPVTERGVVLIICQGSEVRH